MKLTMAVVVSVLAACSDGSTGPSKENATFTPEQTFYAPYQVAVLRLNGAAPAVGADVEGTFGGQPVTLMRSADSAVAFMVPQVSGAQTLAFTIGGREYTGSVNVLTLAPVANPSQYFATLVDDAVLLIDMVEAEIALDPMEDDPRALQMLAMARDSLASFQSRLAQLSAAEAQQVADIVNANLNRTAQAEMSARAVGVVHATAHGMIPAACRAIAAPLGKYKCTWGEFGDAVVDATFGLGGAVVVAKAFAAFPAVGLTAAAGLAVYGGLKAVRAIRIGAELVGIHALLAWKLGTQFVTEAAGYFRTEVLGLSPSEVNGAAGTSAFMMSAVAPPSSMTALTRDRPMTFRISPKLRPVQAGDNLLPVSWLKAGLFSLARFNTFVARFNPNWQLQFAAPATSYGDPLPASEISVEIVGNSNVSLKSLTRDGDRITVTFTSSATGGVSDFTYDVIYSSDVYPDIRVRYDAKLHAPTYQLGMLSDTTLAGDTIVTYGRTRTVMFLLNNDGTLAPNEGFHLVSPSPLPPHVNLDVTGNGGHYVHFDGRITNPNILADTFDITINNNALSQAVKLLDVTVILHDSAGLYEQALVGNWTGRWYNTWNDYMHMSEQVTLNANGTATVLSRTSYPTNAPPDTDNTQIPHEWRLTVRMENGKPVHTLRRDYPGFYVTYDLAYPVNAFEVTYDGTRYVYTRN